MYCRLPLEKDTIVVITAQSYVVDIQRYWRIIAFGRHIYQYQARQPVSHLPLWFLCFIQAFWLTQVFFPWLCDMFWLSVVSLLSCVLRIFLGLCCSSTLLTFLHSNWFKILHFSGWSIEWDRLRCRKHPSVCTVVILVAVDISMILRDLQIADYAIDIVKLQCFVIIQGHEIVVPFIQRSHGSWHLHLAMLEGCRVPASSRGDAIWVSCIHAILCSA